MDMSLAQLLERAADENNTHPWITTPRESLSRVEMWQAVLQAAGGLAARDIGQGDRVAIFCRNGIEFVQIWLAAQCVGATVVPINTGFQVPEAEYVLRHSKSRLILVDSETFNIAESAAAAVDSLELIVTIEPMAGSVKTATTTLADFASGSPLPSSQLTSPHDDDIASVLYTSGTTGPPKGCMLGHDYFAFGANAVIDQLELTSSDVMMCILPLFHMNAQVSSVSTSLHCGASLILEDRFSASGFWPRVREMGVTEFSYLGVVSAVLAKRPPSAEDRNHRLRVGFGAGMPAALHLEFEQRFGVKMLEVFGMTETCMDLATRPVEDRPVGTRTIGTVVPGKDVRIVDDVSQHVPVGEVGHLQVRGAGLFRGYLDDPEATAASFDGDWFRTGDLVSRDDRGWYYYVDRAKDIVRRAGENIGSVEVETVLTSHPSVASAAVIGVEDDVVGHEVKALLVLLEGESETDQLYDSIVEHCIERLAPFKVPRYLQVVPKFPRTASQKTQKQDLRQAFGNTSGFENRRNVRARS